MTFEAGGKQYVAIMSGLSHAAMNKNSMTPSSRSCATRRCCSCSACDSLAKRIEIEGALRRLTPRMQAHEFEAPSWPWRGEGVTAVLVAAVIVQAAAGFALRGLYADGAYS